MSTALTDVPRHAAFGDDAPLDVPTFGNERSRTAAQRGFRFAARPCSGTDCGMATDPLLTEWARHMRAEGLAERTIRERRRIVSHAAALIGEEPARLTPDGIVGYLGGLPSAHTRQTYHSALRAWHRWLLAQRVRDDDPLLGLRRPRAPRREPHPVATTHLDALLCSGIRRKTRTAILLCAYQGLRVHEAAKVRGEDVDLTGRRFRVMGKGGVERWLPLHPLIAAEAWKYPRRGYWFPSYAHPGQPVRYDSLSAVISRAMSRAGVPGTAHSLRHWFGTELVRSGTNVRIVQELMRHASLATTALYTLVDSDQQRTALLSLPSTRASSLPPAVRA